MLNFEADWAALIPSHLENVVYNGVEWLPETFVSQENQIIPSLSSTAATISVVENIFLDKPLNFRCSSWSAWLPFNSLFSEPTEVVSPTNTIQQVRNLITNLNYLRFVHLIMCLGLLEHAAA